MSAAPLINAALPALAGAAVAAATGAGVAAPIGGFEALLASLFGAQPADPSHAPSTDGEAVAPSLIEEQPPTGDAGETLAALQGLVAPPPTPTPQATPAEDVAGSGKTVTPFKITVPLPPQALEAQGQHPTAQPQDAQSELPTARAAPTASPPGLQVAEAAHALQPAPAQRQDPKPAPPPFAAREVIAGAPSGPVAADVTSDRPVAMVVGTVVDSEIPPAPAAPVTAAAPLVAAAAAAPETRAPAGRPAEPSARGPAKAAAAPQAVAAHRPVPADAAQDVEAATVAAAAPAAEGDEPIVVGQRETALEHSAAPEHAAVTPTANASPQSAPPPAAAAGLATALAAGTRATMETVSRLAAQIANHAVAKTTQFDIALEPAGLGKVDVQLRIAHDGTLTAALAFDTPSAAAELRGRAGELQQALQQAGFDLSEGALSFDVADRGQNGGQEQLFDTWRERTLRAFAVLEDAVGAPAFASRRAGPGVDLLI